MMCACLPTYNLTQIANIYLKLFTPTFSQYLDHVYKTDKTLDNTPNVHAK